MHRSAPLFRELTPQKDANTEPVQPIVGCNQITYVSGLDRFNGYVTVMSIGTGASNRGSHKYKVHAGSGYEVYASDQHIYIAATNWNYFGADQGSTDLPDEAAGIWTGVVQFELKEEGELEYKRVFTVFSDPIHWTLHAAPYSQEAALQPNSLNQVPGSIINQFAMDEHDGMFRIASTWGQMWASPPTSVSAVTIYDATTGEKQGEVKGMAPGERIYSCRFMGKKAHIVTFRQVDPLFVLDLSNPQDPKIDGELKIPGFSEYLHPVDEAGQYLIGLGRDADEDGNVKGVKLSLFDVSDPKQPQEQSTQIIGDRGSYTEASYEHKAFLYHRESGILAFPVEERLLTEQQKATNARWATGHLNFVGTIIYDVNTNSNSGFTERGRISHVDPSWYEANTASKEEHNWWRSPPYTRRIYRQTYMKSNAAGGNQEVLFTFSDRQVQVHDLSNMGLLKAQNLTLPQCYDL